MVLHSLESVNTLPVTGDSAQLLHGCTEPHREHQRGACVFSSKHLLIGAQIDSSGGTSMRHTALAMAAALSVVASDVWAQGSKQYTGPLYPTYPTTNVAPYSTGTTPPTPNWRYDSYGYGNR